MGRSVNYHSDNYKILYINFDNEDDYDGYQWEMFEEGLVERLREAAPSLDTCREEWHHREVKKIMENGLYSVWLSEYCGLVSVSFVPREDYRGLAERQIDIIFPKIQAAYGQNALVKLGSFSNGEGVFKRVKATQ